MIHTQLGFTPGRRLDDTLQLYTGDLKRCGARLILITPTHGSCISLSGHAVIGELAEICP